MRRGLRPARLATGAAAALSIALGLFPSSPFAIHAGHIQGKIYDESGRPIAGAVVTATGDAAVGIWHCRTDERGFYRIAGLPASTDITLRVEAEERTMLQRKGYRLRDDQTLRLNFRLRPMGVFSTLIINDPRVPYHSAALAGARETLPAGVRLFEAKEHTPALTRRLLRALAARPDGVLTIGSLAARLARETVFDTPVVYTMVLDPLKENLKAENMCGVPSNGAFSEQIDMLSRMAPQARRLGTLFDPARMDGVVRQLRVEAEYAGFTLEVRSVHEPADVEERLRSLAEAKVDAFMVLLDPGLYTAEVFHQVRAFCEESRIILIVPDAAMVRSGATFSYAPGFRELGAYAGRLLTNILTRKATVADIGVIFPRTRFLSVNPQDVQRFGLTLPAELNAPSTPEAPRTIITPEN